jgi:geranylgeranyl diphosphate synthase type I
MGLAYAAYGGQSGPAALPEPKMARIAAAQELFTDATLIHDDLVTGADTRRGRPSLHRFFRDLHHDSDWAGDSARMGTALAQVIGDALLVISADLFAESLRGAPAGLAQEMSRLQQSGQLQRVLGQAMDAVYPYMPNPDDPEQVIQEAVATMKSKTARHLAALPLALGAAGAGAPRREFEVMTALGLHLGCAYQLHDDVQGALGDPADTGKAAGQDLIDGKRTVLVGVTMRLLGPIERRSFTNALLRGAAPPVEARVEHLQGVIRRSGALEAIETMIADRRHRALECLDEAGVTPDGRAALAEASDWLLTSARI